MVASNNQFLAYINFSRVISKSSDYYYKLDDFDFNGDNRGGWKEAVVQAVHNYAPPGSTRFKLFAKKGTYFVFRKNY
jgi:hypothetical protein